jgi:hypothetical protein
MRLRYANEAKLRLQMARLDRGPDRGGLADAGHNRPSQEGAGDPICTSENRRSVVVDDATGEVFHVGGDGFEYP